MTSEQTVEKVHEMQLKAFEESQKGQVDLELGVFL